MSMEESLSKKVARNTGFNALGYFVSIVALFFLTPYVIGKLGAELYGIWIIIAILTGYWGLSDFGIGLSFQKFVAEYHAQQDSESVNKIVNSGLAFYCFLGVVLLGVAILLVDPLLRLANTPISSFDQSRTVALIAIFNLAIANPLSTFASALIGMQHIDLTRKVDMALVVVRVVFYVVVLSYGWGIVGLILSETFLVLLSAAMNYAFLVNRFPELRVRPWQLDFTVFRRLFAYGSKLQISRLAELVTFQSDRIIVSNFIGLSYVMYADVGGKLLSKIRSLPLIMMSSLIPAISQLGALNQTQRIRLAFDRSTKYLACCAIPLFVFVAAFAHLIMRIWMGDSFSMASFTLQILGLGYLLNVLTGTMSFVLLGMGDATTQMKVTIVQTVLNIAFSIAFVLSFGYYGVMIGTSLSLAISSSYFAIAFNKAMEGSLKQILIIMAQPVIASGVSVVVALIPWIIGGLAPHGRIVDFGLLTAGGLIFFLVYFAILRFTKYFDEWDVEFILRISPKLTPIGRLISSTDPFRGTVKAPR